MRTGNNNRAIDNVPYQLRQSFQESLSRLHAREKRAEEMTEAAIKAEQYKAKRAFYNESLGIIFSHPKHDSLPISISKFLSAAAAVREPSRGFNAVDGRNFSGVEGVSLMDERTFMITDPRYKNKAILVSYDHHRLKALDDTYRILNPHHLYNSAVAPTVVSYSDLLTERGTPSGSLMVIENFDHLNPTAITGQTGYAQCSIYELITQNIHRISKREALLEALAPVTSSSNVVRLHQKPK